MKTDPRTEALSAVGPLTYTLPPLYDGWTVIAVTGGTATRAGSPLTGGATLTAGNELTFTPAAQGGTTTLTIEQQGAEFSGNYADLSGIPAGAGVDAEAVQDIVAEMLGTVGSYNDAAGTYTITLPQPRTDEEIQDVVAALIQAGANVTKTYDDTGNVLTLSASGGGGGGGAGATFMSGNTTDRPSVGSDGMHYLDTQLGKLWRWIAGAWALAATLSLAAPTPTPDLIAIGDSITYGDQAGGPGSAWPPAVGTRRGWTVVNDGQNGTGLTNADSVDGMVIRYSSVVPAGYSGHVVVWGGTNDFNGGQPLGQPGDTDPSTIYGALLTLGRGLLTRGPLTLHLVTPLWRGDSGRTEGTRVGGYTLEQVRQAVRDMAAQLAREYPGRVQLIDAGRDLRDTFSGGSSLMNTDQLHPNATGQAYLGRYFSAQLWGSDGEVTPPSEPSTYTRTFSTLNAGNLNGQDGWVVHSGAFTVSGSGLSVDAIFSSNARGALHAMPAGAARARMLVTAGQPMLHLCHDLSSNLYYAAWLNDAAGVVDWGALSGTSLITGSGAAVTVPGSGPLWVELEASGGTLALRAWRDGNTRPGSPTASRAITSPLPSLSGGQAGLTSITPGTVSVFEIS